MLSGSEARRSCEHAPKVVMKVLPGGEGQTGLLPVPLRRTLPGKRGMRCRRWAHSLATWQPALPHHKPPASTLAEGHSWLSIAPGKKQPWRRRKVQSKSLPENLAALSQKQHVGYAFEQAVSQEKVIWWGLESSCMHTSQDSVCAGSGCSCPVTCMTCAQSASILLGQALVAYLSPCSNSLPGRTSCKEI